MQKVGIEIVFFLKDYAHGSLTKIIFGNKYDFFRKYCRQLLPAILLQTWLGKRCLNLGKQNLIYGPLCLFQTISRDQSS